MTPIRLAVLLLALAALLGLAASAHEADPQSARRAAAVEAALPSLLADPAGHLRGWVAAARAGDAPWATAAARAEAALAVRPGDPQLLTLRAVIRQHGHDFDGALADLGAALARDPGLGQARLTRAFVRATLGRYAGAWADCRALPRAVPPLPRAACHARIASLTGRAAEALALIGRAARADARSGPAVRGWAEGLRGEILARIGQAERAERAYARALALAPGAARLRLELAELLAETGRPEDARALLGRMSTGRALALRLRAAHARGAPAPELMAALMETVAGGHEGTHRHLAEEAWVALRIEGDAEKALRLARANWATLKEPADLRLLLAAALAAGSEPDLRRVRAWRARHGLEDAALDRMLAGAAAIR